MDEKTPSKLFRTLQILIPLMGVAVGLTGVLLTLAARKKELSCTLVNSTRLVSENLGGIHPDMHVEFHGQPIFSLTKMTFDLRNTGAAAIMAKDVVEPVRLAFPPTTRLMTTSVEHTSPQDLKFSANAVPGGDVVLEFPLLNRGDVAFFSVYVFNSEPQRPTLEGRIVDVPQLVYSEANVSAATQNMWPFQSHATRSVVRWALVSIYSALTLLFLGICAGGVGSYVSYLPWKYKWKHLYDAALEEIEKDSREGGASPPAAAAQPKQDEAGDLMLARAHKLAAIRRGLLLHDTEFAEKMVRELKKKGIPPHPSPMFESLGGVAAFSALMLSLASVCSTTGLIVYRALSG